MKGKDGTTEFTEHTEAARDRDGRRARGGGELRFSKSAVRGCVSAGCAILPKRGRAGQLRGFRY